LVKAGAIVGRGATDDAGRPHAEILALASAGKAARGATAYVTLEPHNHQSTSPPCTDALIDAGVRKVVVAVLDPNPSVSGAGVERLRAAGVTVDVGIEADAVKEQLRHYLHSYATGRPYVVMKAGLTLDGNVAAVDGSSQWITSKEARLDVHRLRADVDAVMVGANTLRVDNPLLNVRLDGFDGHQPHPVIVKGSEPLPDAALSQRSTLVISTTSDIAWGRPLVVEPDKNGLPDLLQAMVSLREEGLLSVLAEGGAKLNSALWKAGLIDRGVWYFGAKLGGGQGRPVLSGQFDTLADAEGVSIVDVRMIGPDIRCEFVRK
jgi:diaminohydroxyphosphoribosylaminopyrimidine deaminase/5-amino-6-(5-phosphoribosylamino)uracil reductase